MTSPEDADTTAAGGPSGYREARHASLVTGTIAVGVCAFVGLFLTAALNGWSQLVSLIVPGTLAFAAIATGPPRSAGRRLGWIALAVLATGIAAGLIHEGTSGSYTGD